MEFISYFTFHPSLFFNPAAEPGHSRGGATMSSLTFIEKRTLESFLQMSGGYVLNFSSRTFGEFVEEITGLNIEDQRFNVKGPSKANRLKAIWESESDQLVGKLLNGLIEYAVLPEHLPEPERLSLVLRCQ